jgi:hypothetical protein
MDMSPTEFEHLGGGGCPKPVTACLRSPYRAIKLIDGSRLVYLIKEYLGKDVLIGISKPGRGTGGPASGQRPSIDPGPR